MSEEKQSEAQQKAEPSGSTGDTGKTGDNKTDPHVQSNTPENTLGKLNPSSPGDTGTTPGTNAEIG